MTATVSRFGKPGSIALVAATVTWGVAVVLAESGTTPDSLTQGIGVVSLVLLAIGIVALLKMVIDIYDADQV